MRYLASVLAMLVVVGIGNASDDEIIARLKKAGVAVSGSTGAGYLVFFAIDRDCAGAAIPELCELRCLYGVSVRRRGLTEMQMRAICDLPHLRYLSIADGITDTDRGSIVRARALTFLLLYGAVTDADLKVISGLRSLRTIYLYGADVTGAGICQLVGIDSLSILHLVQCGKVTEEGIAQFRKARPDILINR